MKKEKIQALIKYPRIFLTILKSGKKAAYYVLWLKFLQILLLPVDLIFSSLEKIFLGESSETLHPVIFVVGIQRTGTTFISQIIEEAFPVTPVGNFATLFPRSCYLPHKMFSIFYRKRKHKDYRNYYGISMGLFTIGDSYQVWDRWFGKNHYKIPQTLSEKKIRSMNRYFYYLEKAWQRPVLTKNNRNGMCIKLLNEAVPNAFFIVVNRNSEEVIRSTLTASGDYFGKSGILWGLRPGDDFNEHQFESLTEAACYQYLALEKDIRDQLQYIDQQKYIEVQYEEFCISPDHILKEIHTKLEQTGKYPFSPPVITYGSFPGSKRKGSDEVYQRILGYLEEARSSKLEARRG